MEKDDWKKFENNNVKIALNVMNAQKEKIYPTYVLKNYSNREEKVVLLMISTREKWHYLAAENYQHY